MIVYPFGMLDWLKFVKHGEVVQHAESPNGERVLAILRRRDGFYEIVELKWLGPWDEGDGPLDDGYWDACSDSGVFETAELAERETFAGGSFKRPVSD